MSDLRDLITDCENKLGWTSTNPSVPLWKARVTEMGKVKRQLAKRPELSIEDLKLAVAYCQKYRQPITSPLDLFGHVERAKKLAAPAELTGDVSAVDTAIAWEMQRLDEHSQEWIGRLVRSVGPGRAETYAEWKEAGRG